MDKARTLEVLRGMKFMQRKEEAKRRATFEVAQREKIERQLHANGGDNSGSGASHLTGSTADPTSIKRSGSARATVLYDDVFPTNFYRLARCAFTDTLGGPSASAVEAIEVGHEAADGVKVDAASSTGVADDGVVDSDDESVEDLWDGEDEADGLNEGDEAIATAEASDPTAAFVVHCDNSKKRQKTPGTQHGSNRKEKQAVRNDGRFTVQSAVRAPKLPRRLEESIAEEERERKRRRAKDSDDVGFF